jgi:hypothetical protein
MKWGIAVVLAFTMLLTACSPLENKARDSAAAIGGVLSYAQVKYLDQCKANPSQNVCATINRGVSAQNALVTAVETYCGWSTVAPPPDQTAKCYPVKSAVAGLNTAIANANRLVVEIRGSL